MLAEKNVPQHIAALRRANEIRCARAAMKREIHGGELSIAEALERPEAQTMTVVELLCTQRGWGPKRARRRAGRAGITELRKVRDITRRQRRLLLGEDPDA